jgi:signal transduction histidine kinase
MKPAALQVLLIEDNPVDARLVREMLHDPDAHVGVDFELRVAERLEDGLAALAERQPDAILLDLGLPDSRGLDTFRQVSQSTVRVPILVLTGLADLEMALETARLGGQDYLRKDELSSQLLQRAIRHAVERKRYERASVRSVFERLMRGDLGGEELIENPVITRDGQPRLVSWRNTVLRDEAGSGLGSLSAGQDVSGQRRAEEELRQLNEQLEERVQQRTWELEALNAELESFAYSVSHDLRAPLRAIDGFSRALLEDCGPQLDASGQQYLRRVSAAARQMAGLIDDLLKLSRVTRAELDFVPIDLGQLAEQALAELRQAEPGRQVTVDIQPGLVAAGDPILVRQLLGNLLGNAWKFTAGREPARIRIGREQSTQGAAFFVRDNGVGFDPAYAHKLFVPFQRLHSRDEFAGNGIGLATVLRIVNRHGGRVWAESQPGQGACFWFRLEPGLGDPR